MSQTDEIRDDAARLLDNLSTTDVPRLPDDLQQSLRALALALYHAWPFDNKAAHRRAQARYQQRARDRKKAKQP